MGQLFHFQGVGQASITNRPPKFKHGFSGEVQLVRTEVQKTRHGEKFFASVRVITSNMPEIHPIGQVCSWGQKLLDANIFNGALKVFVAAFAGIPLSNEPKLKELEGHMDNILNAAVASPEQNMLIGRRAKVETEATKTDENRDFMRHNWYAI